MVIPVCYFTDEVSPEIEESLRLGREAGAEAVELRSRLFGKRIDQLTREELTHLRALIAGQGMATACIASSFGKCELDSEEEWREHQAILEGAIRAAQALGTSLIRVFPFWTPGRRDLPRPGLDRYLGRIVERLGWAVGRAQAEGVVLCFETEAATHCGTCSEAHTIIGALGPSPALGLVWDVNNAWHAGGEDPIEDCYPLVGHLVKHLHVKPNARGNIETIAGSGRCYAELLQLLQRDGYGGAASIEHWGSPWAMLEGIRQLRRLRGSLG
ncbi:MAG: sugar phosphate isomerase/epimerase [Anaerolineae bacterium]|nr:sugar phosphate isomerase/epimerase [Anaerolineae bacterium]